MSEITNAQVSQALRQAKARIVKYGWVQGRTGDENTGFCVMGAIWNGAPYGHFQGELRRAQEEALEAAAGWVNTDNALGNWNDAPERTLEDVLSAFDAAIDLVEGRTE